MIYLDGGEMNKVLICTEQKRSNCIHPASHASILISIKFALMRNGYKTVRNTDVFCFSL